MNSREYVKTRLIFPRSTVDNWLNGKIPFAEYDPELGYLEKEHKSWDGIHGAASTYTYDKVTRARKTINYADLPCRINTYGDSFTHCDQVSDGESWQEILAAHLGEPIRNFGCGGHSDYQMFLRMKIEESHLPSDYMVMTMYDDDHFRSLAPLQHLRNDVPPAIFHPPLPYVKVNPSKRELIECPSPAPTPEKFYNFCDLDYVHDWLKDHFILRIMVAKWNAVAGAPEESYKDIEELAEEHGMKPAPIRTKNTLLRTVNKLLEEAAMYAGQSIVQMAAEYARKNRKKIIFVTAYGPNPVIAGLKPGIRLPLDEKRRPSFTYHPKFTEYMIKSGLNYVETLDEYKRRFAQSKLPVKRFLANYYVDANKFVTHHSPWGNRLMADTIRPELVEMLDPKPSAYQANPFERSIATGPSSRRR